MARFLSQSSRPWTLMVRLTLCTLIGFASANTARAQSLWNNSAGGFWQTDANWTPSGAPGSGTDALINLTGSAYSVTLNAATSVRNLTVNSGAATLDLNGQSLLIFGAFNLQAGALNQSGNIALGSGASFAAAAGTIWNWSNGYLSGGPFTNSGTLNYSGSGNRYFAAPLSNAGAWIVTGTGTILADNGSSISNSGLVDLQVDSTFVTPNQTTLTFTNTGTLRKSAGTGTSSINAIVNSTNTIEAQTGTLQFGQGGTVSGTVNALSGATLLLNTLTLSGSVSGTGTGTVRISGGIAVAAGGATINYSGTTFAWDAGSISGPGTLINAGTMNLTTASNKNFATTLNNTGTIAITGTGAILADNGSSITNSGLFNMTLDSTPIATNQIALTFTNASTGIIRKSAGTGVSTINAIVNSTGTIEALTGTLQFGQGGTISNTVNAATGATVNLSTLTLAGSITGSCGGSILLNGSVGVATAGATLNYPGAMLQWSNASLSGPGMLTNTGTINLTTANNKDFATALINTGTITVTGTGAILADNGSVIGNSGLFNMTIDSTPITNNQTTLTFTNAIAGIIRKSGGTGISTINAIVNSTGTIEALTGTLQFGNGGTITNAVNASTNAIVTLNTLTLTGSITGSGGGSVVLNGNVGVAAAGATLNYAGSMLQWSNAGVSGPGTLTNTGNLALVGDSTRFLATTFVNSSTGVVTVTGNATIGANNGSSITNSGLINLQSDSALISDNQTHLTFTNSGTLRKSATTGTSTVSAIFNSTGTVDVQTGTLNFVSNGGNVSGILNAATGATINLNTLTLGGSLTGTGGGAVNLNGTVTVATGGATLNFGGTLAQWRDASISGGTLTNAATLTVVGTATRALGTGFVNNGTFIVTGTGSILANNGSSFVNNGLVDLQADGTPFATNQTTMTLTNTTTLQKSAGAGISTINATVNSTGTILAQSGTLQFGQGGTVSSTISAATGAAVNLNTLTLSGTITGTGGGTVNLNGGVSVASAGAVLNYGGTLAQWTNAGISGPGTLTNSGTLTTSGGANRELATTLANSGTINIADIGSILTDNGSAINNSGTFNLQVDSTVVSSNQITLPFTNTGTVRKSAGTGTSTFNSGFINNGGTIAIPTGTILLGGGLSFGNGSKLELTGGATANMHLAVNGLVQNTGTQPLLVRLFNDGTLDLTGATEYSWLVLAGTNLGSLTPDDFSAAGGNFTPVNASFNFNSNNVFVTFNAVPTPEPTGLIGVACAGLIGIRRLTKPRLRFVFQQIARGK